MDFNAILEGGGLKAKYFSKRPPPGKKKVGPRKKNTPGGVYFEKPTGQRSDLSGFCC